MKRITLLFSALMILASSFASMTPTSTPALKASEIFIPIGKSGQRISLMDLASMKADEFATLTGKDMNFFDRAGFKISQKSLRNSINTDGTINKKRMNKFLQKQADGDTGFHLGGFALGFLLGLLGVLLAYVAFEDDKKRNRVKWSWIGLGVGVVLYIVLVAALI